MFRRFLGMKILGVLLGWGVLQTLPLHAQESSGFLDCLEKADQMTPGYRDVAKGACLSRLEVLCLNSATPIACIEQSNEAVRGQTAELLKNLPPASELTGVSGFRLVFYERTLARLGNQSAQQAPECKLDLPKALETASCELIQSITFLYDVQSSHRIASGRYP